MQRAMKSFHQDAEAHWVAELVCGHTQHVRHQPPFTLRPWVLTPEGRAARLGRALECPACDRREMPVGHAAYKRTALFTQDSLPAGLLREHGTKPGVWGLLHVVRGELEFIEVQAEGESHQVIGAGQSATILPELAHRVLPLGAVEFFVEFWQAEASAPEI